MSDPDPKPAVNPPAATALGEAAGLRGGGPPARPEPGERPPRRLLDRPPSDRYRQAEATIPVVRVGSPARATLLGVGAAAVGTAVHVLAAVPLSWTSGLLVVAVSAGWATGWAVRFGAGPALRPAARRLLAVVLALACLAVALAVNWALSGRYLAPGDYLDQVYGLLVPAQVAAIVASAVVGTR